MRVAGWSGNKGAVGDGVSHSEIDVRASGLRHLRTDRGIRAALLSLDDVRRRKNLRAMAQGGDGFIGFCKVVDNLNNAQIEAKVFGSATAGDDQCIVVLGLDLVEGGIEGEIVAALFGVGLIALEIVDGRADILSRFFAGTY